MPAKLCFFKYVHGHSYLQTKTNTWCKVDGLADVIALQNEKKKQTKKQQNNDF
jgi:hypothetical protein